MNVGAILSWKFNNQSGMTVIDNAIIEFPGDTPSNDLLEKWSVEFDAWEKAKQYKTNRSENYAIVEDQLDMIYWDLKNQTKNWENHIDDVKNRFPKEGE